MIIVRGLTKSYGYGKNRYMVLDNVSFAIPDGASVAIIGKSGSGKSSLVHAISGLARPEFGEVFVHDHDILKMTQAEVDIFRARKMGFIFQSFFVQNRQTCAKNISLPLEILGLSKRQREPLVDEALKAVGLFDKKQVKAYDLSGGQKQRLAIARAIVNRPRILFADEPTGNLDSTTGDAIENLLFWCNKTVGMTLIIVTHDPDFAAKCDIQIRISDGKIASMASRIPLPPQPTITTMTKESFAEQAKQAREERERLAAAGSVGGNE